MLFLFDARLGVAYEGEAVVESVSISCGWVCGEVAFAPWVGFAFGDGDWLAGGVAEAGEADGGGGEEVSFDVCECFDSIV